MVNLRVHPNIYPQPPETGFIPMPAPTLDGSQYAQMLTGLAQLQNKVVPIPYANNNFKDKFGNFAVTCINAANSSPGPQLDQRDGYVTADILNKRPSPEAPRDTVVVQKVLDVIANPERSHVFNTDCVSCHTETPLFQLLLAKRTLPGIHPCALPRDNTYNTRAFGWAVETFNNPTDPPPPDFYRPTVSRRAANETTKVVDYVNRELLGTSATPPIIDVAECADDNKR
jgi:hypothetical protein